MCDKTQTNNQTTQSGGRPFQYSSLKLFMQLFIAEKYRCIKNIIGLFSHTQGHTVRILYETSLSTHSVEISVII